MFVLLDAPDVSVLAHNTTTSTGSTTLTCVAVGVPSTYTFVAWEHTWYKNTPVFRTFAGKETLTLDDLTYETSGVYTCKAENGVSYSTNSYYGFGSVLVTIKGKCNFR